MFTFDQPVLSEVLSGRVADGGNRVAKMRVAGLYAVTGANAVTRHYVLAILAAVQRFLVSTFQSDSGESTRSSFSSSDRSFTAAATPVAPP